MKLSIELLNVLGIILPGLMALKIQDLLTTGEEKPLHEQIIFALLYSYVIYLLTSLILDTWEPLITFKDNAGSTAFVFTPNKSAIFTVTFISILLPLLISLSKHADIPMKWLRKFKFTKKSSMENTWSDTFHNEHRMIQIYLKDQRIIRGWPHRYSSDPKDGFIYLANPIWINTDAGVNDPDYIETNAHGFLISREEIDFIEFSLKDNETQDNNIGEDWNE